MAKSWPAPSRADHKRFVEREGWQLLGNAKGKEGDRIRYALQVDDGRVLRTRISHPPSAKKTYGKRMWRHILRDQLEVTEEEFWACVKDGILPARSRAKIPQGESVPAGVVAKLIQQVGLSEDEVKRMTRNEAVERLERFYTEGS